MTLYEMRAIAKDIDPANAFGEPQLVNGVWRFPPKYVALDFTQLSSLFTVPISVQWPEFREPDPPTPLPVRKSSETIYGWRAWDITAGHLLESIHNSTTWEGPVLRADGAPSDHDPFIHGGTNGIYSWSTAMRAARYAEDDQIIGRIVLSGRVVKHERGYRSEVATMDRLHVPLAAYRKGRLSALRDRYQCPVFTDWRKFIRKERDNGYREGN